MNDAGIGDAWLLGHDSDLPGDFDNLVHRTMQFVKKFRDGVTPNEPCDPVIREEIGRCYLDTEVLLESGEIKTALERISGLIWLLNRFFDLRQPWRTECDDPDDCDRTLATCLHGIVNLAQLLQPFMPIRCARIRQDLQLDQPLNWDYQDCPCGRIIGDLAFLFPRLDNSRIEEGRRRLSREEPATDRNDV